ncbi:MAG: hypothetical protein DRH03_03470 [Deltaproteobacteria bacterium]|nr:MAG: hypothetical protein DRH03_03470 [Deltaproteobacteria bacterium]
MRLTCPHCQSLCRLKDDRLNSRAKQGRCPNCGNLFPLPPNNIEQTPTTNHQQPAIERAETNKTNQPESNDKNSAQNSKHYLQELTRPTIKTSALLLFTGLCLTLSLAIFLTSSNKPLPAAKEKQQKNTSQTHTQPEPKITLQLSQKTRDKTISLIKHHALVTDASININRQQFELALLVSGKTPVSYSERLGRQFAHYIKTELTTNDRTKSTFLVSVYYPDGTRVEVTTNDNNMDEEIIFDPPTSVYH